MGQALDFIYLIFTFLKNLDHFLGNFFGDDLNNFSDDFSEEHLIIF